MWAIIPLFESTPALARRVFMLLARRVRFTFSFLYLLALTMIRRPSLRVGGVEEGALGPLRGGAGVGAVGAFFGLTGTSFLRALLALLLVTVAQDGVVGAGAGEDISSSSSSVCVGAGATYFLGPSAALRGARLVVTAGMSESEEVVSSSGVGAGARLGWGLAGAGARNGAGGAGGGGAGAGEGEGAAISLPFLDGAGFWGRGMAGLVGAAGLDWGRLRILSLSSLFWSRRKASFFSNDSNLLSCASKRRSNRLTIPV